MVHSYRGFFGIPLLPRIAETEKKVKEKKKTEKTKERK